MARRLKAIAEEINRLYPMWEATVTKETVSTDRTLRGGGVRRLCVRGKGRTGNRLIVRWRHLSTLDRESKVFDHSSAETYRSNDEVERWLTDEAPKLSKQKKPKSTFLLDPK